MSNKSDEKDRLMAEVLGKKRTYEKNDESTDIKLTTDNTDKETEDHRVLKSMDSAFDQLSAILKKQSEDLKQMTNQLKSDPGSDIKPETVEEVKEMTSQDIDKLEKDLEKDYGTAEEKKETAEEPFDSAKAFKEIEESLNEKILGQKDAIKSLVTAFRRPYVMGVETGRPKNVILVSGPTGSGKHASLTEMAAQLYQRQVFVSKDVYTMDLSRYTSGSQEQIFLQDLYEGLSGNYSVICFENFESCFPGFLRMVNSLVVDGACVLNKRYVLTKGILVENQTGLVKDSVDHLSAAGKYLVFVTSGKVSKVQDSFGADFMYHVLDRVETKALDDDTVKQIIQLRTNELIEKCNANLHVQVASCEELAAWTYTHFDKTRGADSIQSLFYDYYVSIAQGVLDEGLGSNEEVKLSVTEDVPYAEVNGKQIRLSREKNSAEEIASVNKELDEIVGLNTIKDYIRSLQAHISVQEKRKEQGMTSSSVSKHMIFTGNPGTGKTTIARLISRYMKAVGALSEGQLVEVTRADLVAQYVGQTAPLTMSVIRSALGGVLFIDEAYSLYRGKDDSFGLEAIDTLVKAMEDNRDNLIVILAGYKKEMAVFLESNSGLKSRFPNVVDFPDYTGEELTKIAAIQAKSKGYTIDEAALEPLTKYFDKVQSINAAEAGNGRLARNLVEDATIRQSQRLSSDSTKEEMSLIKTEDFDFTVKVKAPENKDSNNMQDLMDLINNSKK